MAVTKSRVASILPLMRRWKDALMEWNLIHNNYLNSESNYVPGRELDFSWPTDWSGCIEGAVDRENDYW